MPMAARPMRLQAYRQMSWHSSVELARSLLEARPRLHIRAPLQPSLLLRPRESVLTLKAHPCLTLRTNQIDSFFRPQTACNAATISWSDASVNIDQPSAPATGTATNTPRATSCTASSGYSGSVDRQLFTITTFSNV